MDEIRISDLHSLIAAVLVLASMLGGCVGQVPKSYTWRVVDCTYHREGIDVMAKCELEGTAELGSPELGNIID